MAFMLLVGSWQDCNWRKVVVFLLLSLIMTSWLFFVGIGGEFDCLKTDAYDSFGKKLKLGV